MSTSDDAEAVAVTCCCASCGIAEEDDVKLKQCADCDLVRYCSDECQQEHRPHHKRACNKRAAELRDEILFRQPESSYLGDCPICCLPLSLNRNKSTMMTCCSKVVCRGCAYANKLREEEENLQHKCPFCRHPAPKTKQEANLKRTKRVGANDPVAIRDMGEKRYHEGDYGSAFEYYTKAAGLGSASAHYSLSLFYRKGEGVEKNEKMDVYHLEEAAIGGHPDAREEKIRESSETFHHCR